MQRTGAGLARCSIHACVREIAEQLTAVQWDAPIGLAPTSGMQVSGVVVRSHKVGLAVGRQQERLLAAARDGRVLVAASCAVLIDARDGSCAHLHNATAAQVEHLQLDRRVRHGLHCGKGKEWRGERVGVSR